MKRIFTVLLGFVFVLPASADVIRLKNGIEVEGKILSSTDQSTLIKTGVKIVSYAADQIEEIIDQDDDIVPVKSDQKDEVDAASEELTDDKRKLILKLLDLNGIGQLVDNNIASIMSDQPASRQIELKKLLRKDEILELFIPIYAERFTTQELTRLVNFFDTPTGRRYVEAVPDLMKDAVDTLVSYFKMKIEQ